MPRLHREFHRAERVGWLRAAVLGANDGIISVASLMVGIAASGADRGVIFLTGMAGLVAGAMSMAAGEYVSVRSQADTEEADLARERRELETEPARELAELASIYESRGLDAALALRVAEQLTAGNALEAHARDELGITEALRARPVQASIASAAAFAAGALVPLLTALAAPAAWIAECMALTALVMLLALGAGAAWAGGAARLRGALRVALWGASAMGLTALLGQAFGTLP